MSINEFIKLYGKENPDMFSLDNLGPLNNEEYQNKLKKQQEFKGLNTDGLVSPGLKDVGLSAENQLSLSTLGKGEEIQNTTSEVNSVGEATKGSKMGLAQYADIGMGAYQLSQMAQAKNYDTSADGGGPGKQGGAMLMGAATGLKAGMATGNPYLAGAGLVIGAGAAMVGHKAARKEYKNNQTKRNLNENALEKAKRQEETDIENGLASMQNLKALRQKQLGIIY